MSMSRSDHMAPGFSSHLSSSQATRSQSPGGSNSPVDPSTSNNRSPFGLPGGIMAGNTRSGTGSPSHDMAGSSRLFSKRAREIQAQEGIPSLPVNPWGGPPTSGNSTPLRENIPESPTDGFPGYDQLPTQDSMPQTRRARAGTVPSRMPGGPVNGLLNVHGLAAKSARVTPSQSPFGKSPSPNLDYSDSAPGGSALLSRLRAGSLPQRSPFSTLPGTSSPFGPSIFSSWNPAGVGRERGSTLASIASVGSNGPSSPSQSQFSKEGAGDSDVHMRTLDYLGLAETPQAPPAQLATPYYDYSNQANRFRSYSVNNKDRYEDDGEPTPGNVAIESQYDALKGQLAATNAAIHNHNLAVQAFINNTRPRARTTAAVLETMRTLNAGIPNPIAPAEIRLQDEKEYDDLPQAMTGMNIGRSNSRNAGLLSTEEQGLEGPTSALWLGGIPTSTTTSTLVEMFKSHGPIISARVLTHKNCGFVNFERVESSIAAKASMNGKEIFPGAGPIRINFAKPPSASNTPGHDGIYPSPSPDPFAKAQDGTSGPGLAAASEGVSGAALGTSTPVVPPLADMPDDILDIVELLGATDEDRVRISQSVQSAIQYTGFVEEIPAIREPNHTRVHDAPKLRDIRKRIDTPQLLTQLEVENIAMDMLPEIAELSSDYLGNTVVQKLFEQCSDQVRDAMLAEIAPHLAEIGIHKNGTWAAQKIIEVCKTPQQMNLIVEHLRPYTVPLFLDQYGNYVLQVCLRFGAPYNDFIFETMLSRMWEVSQGRFGARAMRACLESHHSTKDQQKMLAAVIALHSVQLATNANGALLLTWFLDTCTFPKRRTVLAPRLVPCLVHLCTHKVAYLTVLKVINQKAESDARDVIFRALFFSPNDQILEAILQDPQCGATLIFKVLTTPFFDESIRAQIVENVKSVLVRIKAQPNQGYKRLMDEAGLSTRATPSREPSNNTETRQRPTSRQANNGSMNGQHTQGGQQSSGNNSNNNKSFYSAQNTQPSAGSFDAGYGSQRSDGADANVPAFHPYGQGMMYNAPAVGMAPPLNMSQLQYQQNMMNRATPHMGYNFPPMQAPYGTYGAPAQGVDQYRQPSMANGSPIQPPSSQMPPQMPIGQPPYAPPGFGVGYGYGNIASMQNIGYLQQEPVNNRRGGRR
ncbi:hypothetical protein QQS21_009138 [Conoideocrella luteorostrata]|uniref:RNA binding protein Jsn1 n=1 Tax=Conoideocrella luteorostrata TaxID=1105319 RepID=A0AAJ0CLX4_9HYPO|nr:hypothetical protein QQS21_009138 [Conoideocrella luteorostrata]